MSRNAKLALLISSGVVALVVIAFVGWVLMLPESGVKMANEMDAYALDYLDKHQILNQTERLLCYYDATISMDGSEAAILTNQRLLYHKQGRTTAVPLVEVVDIEHHYESLLGDVILAHGAAGEVMKIEIAPLNGGELFSDALMKAWQQVVPPEEGLSEGE
jgi:hypothetical protein